MWKVKAGVDAQGPNDTSESTSFTPAKYFSVQDFLNKNPPSKIVAPKTGEPLVVYHFGEAWTVADETQGEIGTHFGSKESARERFKDIGFERFYEGEFARTTPVYLSLQNPLMVTDLGVLSNTNPDNYAFAIELRSKGIDVREGAKNEELRKAIFKVASIRLFMNTRERGLQIHILQ